jgi:transposase
MRKPTRSPHLRATSFVKQLDVLLPRRRVGALARETGFEQRTPRKCSPLAFLVVVVLGAMARPRTYSPEFRERAVRLVFENQEAHESQWAAIVSIADKMGCTAETLRKWVRQAERDVGRRPGLTSGERDRLKELEREVRELRRANEILRKASAFFAQAELDRRPK